MGLHSWLYESIATCLSIASFIAILYILQVSGWQMATKISESAEN